MPLNLEITFAPRARIAYMWIRVLVTKFPEAKRLGC